MSFKGDKSRSPLSLFFIPFDSILETAREVTSSWKAICSITEPLMAAHSQQAYL